MNPLDANALETALRLKEKYGGTVTAVSMGPPQADEVLKKALAMGCDESALLGPALSALDTLATSYPLAKAAEKLGGYDLLICGHAPADAETTRTGPSSPPPGSPGHSPRRRSRSRTLGPLRAPAVPGMG